ICASNSPFLLACRLTEFSCGGDRDLDFTDDFSGVAERATCVIQVGVWSREIRVTGDDCSIKGKDTSMDYDGNDSQDHNLKVAGESTSKSSSVLKPYAFPRFELDESLQGHLRFDSLVETDVFLGVQSQDENHWIEDFSRGSDVIDFSSTATESCSIARQSNVWFEAASSESVEMLLKSVGQEQIQPKGTVSESNNTCEELCSLAKEMEPKFEQDDVNSVSTGISNDTALQDELLNNVSGLENHVTTKLLQVEGITLSQENLDQGDKCSSQMCPNDPKEECTLPITGEALLPGSVYGIKNIQETERPSAFEMKQAGDGLSDSAGTAKDINSSSSILVPSPSPDLLSSHSEGRDIVSRATGNGVKEQLALEMVPVDSKFLEQRKLKDAMHADGLTSSVECLDKKTDIKVTIDSNESSMMSCTHEYQFQLLEGTDKDNCPASPALPGSGQSDILSASKVTSASLTDNLEQHVTKLGNPNVEQCSRSEANVDSVEDLDLKFSSDEVDNVTKSSLKDGGQFNLVLESNSQSPLIKGENEPSTDKISNTNIVDLCESLVGPISSSSAGLTMKTGGAEIIEDFHDAAAVNMEGSRSSGHREDFEVKPDQQSNAIENEDNLVETETEESISLPTIIIDASSRTCVAPTSVLGSSAMMRNTSQDEPIVDQTHSGNEGKMETGSANYILNSWKLAKSAPPVYGTDGLLIPVMETCMVSSGSKSPTLNSGECSTRSELHPDHDDSILNKGSMKLECNSPTIISSVITPPDGCKLKGDGSSEIAENKPSASEDLNGKFTSLDDNSFTFKVNLPPYAEREKANTWTPFPIAETYTPSVEEVTTPDSEKVQTKLAQETSGKNPGDHTHEISKATSGRKRRGSGKGAAKENLHKGVIIKETPPDRPSYKKEITSTVSLSPGSSLAGQFTGSRPHGITNHKSKKQSTKNDVPTSNLPDLNASALKNHNAPSRAYYQTFTELQQIQLRAQIFVYGSLIQGTAPDEACMISAFGSSDRGRVMWEAVWQAAVERVHSQRSKPAVESPVNSHSSGTKVPELSGRNVSPEIKVFPSSASLASSKGVSTAILSPLIPLPSPLWSFSTPYSDVSQSSNMQKRPVLHYQPAISPRQLYQTPPVQNIIGHTTLLPQTQAFPSPWVSQTSVIDVNARFPTTAVTEMVKLTPAKDFSLPAPSFVKNVPSPSLVYTDTTSTVYARSSQLSDQIKGSVSLEVPPSADSKPRRRKKAQPLDSTQNFLCSQAHTETIAPSSLPTLTSPLTLVTSHSGPVTTPVGYIFPARSTSPQQVGNMDAGKASACSLETLHKVEDADPKPRRRKKAKPLDSTPQNLLLSKAHTETMVATSLPTLTSPVALLTSHSDPVTTPIANVLIACSTSQQEVGNLDVGKASACSGEILQKVEDARLLSEEAAGFAASAISHCQSLWSQLAKQDLRMAGDAEAQIAAAAGAAAAAASVAKAASVAARVASNAALQVKLMADEAFIPNEVRDVAQRSITQIVGSATPMSILTTDNASNQSSSMLIGTNREGKEKLVANSASAKQAENLRDILEAAKLAAEAVSQAGKVVAMGKPLPLKALVSAGPEGYWKLPVASSELVTKSGNENEKKMNIGSAQVAENSHEEHGGSPGGKILDRRRLLAEDPSNESFGNNTTSASSISVFVGVGDKDPGGDKSHKISNLVQSNSGLSLLGSSSGTVSVQKPHELGTDNESNIKEGSAVEVYKDGEGLKPAWFSANVLSLNDGKAHVQYTSLFSKEGSDHLTEWVALEGEGDKAPSIRASLPMTASHSQGTRKRRRSALGNHVWMVGDMVDVWIQDSWYEGIVTDKNENDEATLTVHFPARGETSAVSTQQLRLSRMWADGNWVQWSRLRGHDCSNESDMPLEKRARLKSPFGKPKSEEVNPAVGKPEESKFQALSASDMIFNVGKSTKAETKPDARRPWKTGLQKEGSRVVFGAPKPGKKRKFVEVSKHFPASQNGKNDESKDQVKFAKYLMPRGTTSRGGKIPPKVDTKEKQPLKVTSLKPRSSSSRTVAKKDNLLSSASSQYDEAVPICGLDVEKSAVHEEDTMKLASLTDHGSSRTNEAGKRPQDSSFKKSSSSNSSDLPNNGKLVPAGGKPTRDDEKNACDDNSDSTLVELEPRRSNRRIQPTHRLLEGLQSSLIIPKMTSVSNDKGQKSRSTDALSRGTITRTLFTL
ncbi:hypothetical protein V2J09_000199, partial [Rumex salicifolius]